MAASKSGACDNNLTFNIFSHVCGCMFECAWPIRDLTRTDSPIYDVKAHKSCLNVIDGCGGQNIGAWNFIGEWIEKCV